MLANDTDADGDVLSASLVDTSAAHGSLTLSSDGALTYTPAPAFSGTATVTYRVFDGALHSAPATITIRVRAAAPVNHAPVAADASATVHAGSLLNGPSVLALASDPDGDVLTAGVGTAPAHAASFSLDPITGTYLYRPAPGYVGTDAFTYRVSDGNGGEATASITISVTDSAPVANADSAITSMGGSAHLNVLSNDTDADGDTLSVASYSAVSTGTLTTTPSGDVTFTPPAGFTGTATLTYKATDGAALSASATVTFTVVATNEAPSAADDTYRIGQGSSATLDVLTNDSDPEAQPLSVAHLSVPSTGTVSLSATGSVIYTPPTGWSGSATFTYQAFDGELYSNTATVTVRVVGDVYVATGGSDATGDGTQAHPYLTVRNAAQQSAPGFSIIVGPGEFTSQNLTMPVGVSLRGAGASKTTITARDFGSALVMPRQSQPCTIEGITVTGGRTSTSAGGAISAYYCAPIIKDCVIDSNASKFGGGIFIMGCTSPQVVRCTFRNNTAQVVGGLAISTSTSATVEDCTFSGQEATSDASDLYFADSQGAKVSNSVFSRGSVADGEVVRFANSTASVLNCTIAGGSAKALSAVSGAVVTVSNTIAWDNLPTGLLTASGGTLSVNHSDVERGYPGAGNIDADPTFQNAADYRLSGGSPAIDAGTSTDAPASDASGTARPQGVGVDMGAYEYVFTARTAREDRATVVSGRSASLNVLANDDPSESTKTKRTAVLVSAPADGFVSLSPSGDATYTAPAGFTGTVEFSYYADYETTRSASTRVIVTVGSNRSPVALSDSALVHTGTLLRGTSVLANDYDPDGDPLTAQLVAPPTHAASFTLNADGTYSYRSQPGFAGIDLFSYRVSDGLGTSGIALVTIDVHNVTPVALDDSATVGSGASTTIDLLANDTDSDGDSLSVMSHSDVSTGTLSVSDTGRTVYTAPVGFTGAATFTYKVTDGVSESNTATVTFNVIHDDQKPVARDDALVVQQDDSGTVDVLANDTDADTPHDSLIATSFSDPAHGTIKVQLPGRVTYTPDTGFMGTDSVTYRAFDGTGFSEPATLSITVAKQPDGFLDPEGDDIAPGMTLTTTFTVGVPATFTVSALGDPAPVLQWLGEQPPAGPVSGSSGRDAFVAGTAEPDTAGTYHLMLKATNAGGSASLNVNVVVLGRQCTIAPSASDHGRVEPSTPQKVDYGHDSPAFSFTPDSGYHISEVFIDEASIGASSSVTLHDVRADHTVRVVFAKTKPVVRIGGSNRYSTSVAVARTQFPNWGGVRHVVLASGDYAHQPDALTGAGLAKAYNAPLLLIPKNWVDTDIKRAILSMPKGVSVHIVGGTSAVSTKVSTAVAHLSTVHSVDRVSGSDRFDTAARVAVRMKKLMGSRMPGTAIITNGWDTYGLDVLVASTATGAKGFPVLLTRTDALPKSTASALRTLGIRKRYILGSTRAVPDCVRIAAGVALTDRIAGTDIYGDSVAFADVARANGWLPGQTYGFAATLPDAATGGTFMGSRGAPLLLVGKTWVPSQVQDLIGRQWQSVEFAYSFGSEAALTEPTRQQLERNINGWR